MRNVLKEAKKSFKSRLKNNKKLYYSAGMVISYLLTGGFAQSAPINRESNEKISEISESLEKQAEKLRSEIKKRRDANEERLKLYTTELSALEREGDHVIKSPWENVMTSWMYEYNHMKKENNNWNYGTRTNTAEDNMRDIINQYLGYNKGHNGTSGWITGGTGGAGGTNAWNENTQIYDHTGKLTAIPTINIPQIKQPGTFELELPQITTPVIPGTPSITINPVDINVNTPVIVPIAAPTIQATTTPDAPSAVTVQVTSPNVEVSVGEVNITEISDITSPNISINTPNVSVSYGVKSPPLAEPSPDYITPDSPEAPDFTAFNRGRGEWLGGFSNIRGVNAFNRQMKAWEQGNPPRQLAVNNQPMFNVTGVIQGYGKGSGSTVIATTDPSGKVVNKYDQIQIVNGASGGTPNNQYAGGVPYPIREDSPVGFAPIAPGEWVSAEDNDTLQGFSTTRLQQSWIFQGTPVVQDMNIIIGGSTTRSTAIFAQVPIIKMNRVSIELKGKTIIGQLDIRGAYNVSFNDLDINITGNENSLLTTYSTSNFAGSPTSIDMRTRNNWGKSRIDDISNLSAVNFGGTILTASTSKNTIFYIAAPTIDRWTGASSWYRLPGTGPSGALVYESNPEKYLMYAPVFGNVRVENQNGNVEFTGSGNIGIWVTNYVPDRTKWASGLSPELDLGIVKLQGDKNVAYYLAGNRSRPDRNAVFQGNIKADIKFGTDIDGKGGTTQIGTGNIGTDNKKSEDNVGIYVDSGQRSEMNNTVGTIFQEYFPATIDFIVDTTMYSDIVGILNGTQIGYSYLSADPIKNLKIKDFDTEFGKFSKNGIALVAKNGSVVDINKGSLISDNAGTNTDRAEGTTMFYAEGVWYNPRKAMTTGTYDKEAYGRGESQTGRKNIVDFNTTINIADNIAMSSYEATALFAKNGGMINAQDILTDGYGSIGAFASGINDLTDTVSSNNTGAGTQAETKITLKNLKMTGVNTDGSYGNIGVAAISQDDTLTGTGKISVTVNGTLDVKGIGAIARGSNASVKIANGDIKTGVYGGLIAQDGGKIEFQSGKITHKTTHTDTDGKPSHENTVVFYADNNNSNINFTGASSLEMHDGILFYGDTNDYSSGNTPLSGETGKYTGMNNVTVNLQGNGVNLGSYKNMTGLVWDSTNSYLNGTTGLKNITKVKEINPNTYWYTSALEGGDITVKSDVNRDVMDAANAFNKIIMEKVAVTIDPTSEVHSVTSGNGLIMGSNNSSMTNADSGYTIKGTVDIGAAGGKISSGAYVSFGHIIVESTGALKATNGVGAYGVNGSKIKNSGLIEIGKRSDSETGIGIVGLSRRVDVDGNVDTAENYGTDALINSKVIDIENEGTIRVTNGSGNLGSKSIGIFVDNNINSAQSKITVGNSGLIEVGDESVGIQIKGDNGGELTLKTKTAGSTNIKVGNKGVGVFAENSKIKFDGDYKFNIGLGGAGIVMSETNTYELLNNPTLTIINNQTDNNLTTNPGFVTGMYYERGEGKTVTNKFNLNLGSEALEDKSSIIGIYVKGNETTGTDITKVVNEGTIKAGAHDYGIYVEKGNLENKGSIEVGADGTGIAVVGGSLKTRDDLIKVDGSNGLGLYLKGNESTPLTPRVLEVSGSAGSLEVNGEAGVGIFVSGKAKLINNGKIRLSDSANPISGLEQQRKIGIYLKDTKEANESNGDIFVGKDNIGVYGINSNLQNNGNIYVTETTGEQNIGVYIKSKGTGQSFELKNNGLLEVEGQKSIGLHAISEDGSTGKVDLTNGNITVKSSNIASNTNIPLGVYVKGNGINVTSSGSKIDAGANTVGVYIDGVSTLGTASESYNGEYNLSSSNNSTGIGAYLKGGAEAQSGTIKIKSTSSQSNGTSGVVRPIGLLYSENQSVSGVTNGANLEIVSGSQEVIGLYGEKVKKLKNTGNITVNAKGIGVYLKDTGFDNTGKITVTGNDAYGMYISSDETTESRNSGEVTLSGEKSIGIITSKKAKVINNGKINADVSGSIGAYVTEKGIFVNDTGNIINSNYAQTGTKSGSTGIVSKGGTAENKGIINSEYLGIYGTNGTDRTQIIQRGSLNINSGTGIYLKDDGSINTVSLNLEEGSQIKVKSGLNSTSAVVGTGNSKITSNGGSIKVNASSNGIALIGDTNKTSTLELYGGTIETGENSVGVYSEKAKIHFREDSTAVLNLGKSSTGIYVDRDSSLEGTGKVNIGYNDALKKGVGIYYKEGTQINNIEVSQSTGNKNLINIYGENVDLTNNARQIVGNQGLGIYATGTAGNQSVIRNNGELNLSGEEAIGIYAEGNTEIGSLGNITGSESKNNKIGIFLAGGDITGNQSYDFNIDGGIGLYLKNHIGYTGQINLLGNEYTTGGKTYRAIGVIVDKDAGAGNLSADLKMSGTNGVGIYLASDNITGADLTYTGKLEMNGLSSEADKGIGVYVSKGATFNLGTGGELNIAGTNNIGFYVAQGGNLNIGNGTVTNTEEGIFAYLEGGHMTFTPGSSNINYANVIVSSGGSLINQTGITTGKSGLQGTGTGSLVLNDINGTISSNTENAVAMAGEKNAAVTNDGKIQMTGNGSVGLYVNGATGISTGEVIVGNNSIAYYAKDTENRGNILTINPDNTTIGEKSILLAAGDGGQINYQGGPINLGDKRYGVLIGGSNANGINSSINFNGHDISVGKESIAVILEGGELNATLGNMHIGAKGVGIYSSKNISKNNTSGRTINLSENAMGIYGENGIEIVFGGEIKSSSEGAKGIININKSVILPLTGQIINEGLIELTGEKSIGIYGENINLIANRHNNSIKTGGNLSIGLSGKNVNNILNEGSIEIKDSGVGIYGDNTVNLRNTGLGVVTSNNEGNVTGIYGLNSNIYNEGVVELGDSSNGIYAENSSIENTGTVSVGNSGSTGIYGGLGTTIYNSGTVKVGNESVGLATTDGTIVNNGNVISTGRGTTYLYTKTGRIENNGDLVLTDYSTGIYSELGEAVNNGKITVGQSDLTGSEAKYSIGMVTEKAKIVNSALGEINVAYDSGVGMFVSGEEIKDASDKVIGYGIRGLGENHGVINVTGTNAVGIQVTNGGKVHNAGIINVSGSSSKGIGATKEGEILNTGKINVTGTNNQGIYVDGGAKIDNRGEIKVSGSGNTGIYIGTGGIIKNEGKIEIDSGASSVIGGGGSMENIGDIVINGLKVTIDGVEIKNTGKITINGELNFENNVILDTTAGQIGTIEVGSVAGEGNIILTPGATQGSNKEVYQVQLVDGLGSIPGGEIGVISQSVSFLGEKHFDSVSGQYVLTLVKIPYEKLLQNTKAEEFGKGLDQLYTKAVNSELNMFDALDLITDKDELARTFDTELRGNIYANIQDRMKNVNNVFDSAYRQLKEEENPTKKNSKVTAIYVKGNESDKNPGVENYDYNSVGIMYLRETEGLKYGKTLNYSLGFVQSNFDFDQGSKENISSIQTGLGLDKVLSKDNRFKFETRGELGVNYHDTKRKIYLSNGTYTNKADYFSGTAEVKNYLRYELPLKAKNLDVNVFGSFKAGYGMYQGFKESGDGIYLEGKSEDYVSLKPGVGLEGKYKIETGKGGAWNFNAEVSYEYELMDIYDDGNRVKIKGTTAGYYNLEKPEERDNILKAGAGIEYETGGRMKIGGRVEKTLSEKDEMKYQLDFTWKF